MLLFVIICWCQSHCAADVFWCCLMLHMAVWYHLVTTDVTSCSERLKVAVKCWLWCAMLQVAVCGCMSSFTIVSCIVLLIVFVCWCSLMLLDTSWGCMLSIGDYRCYKVQWVVASCNERLKVVVECWLCCVMLQIVVGCWVLRFDAICCCMQMYVIICHSQLHCAADCCCLLMWSGAVGCWVLWCDAACGSVLSVDN